MVSLLVGYLTYGRGSDDDIVESFCRDEVQRAIQNDALSQFAEAEKRLVSALERCPDYAEAWRELHNARIGLGKYSDAINAASRALKIKPDDLANKFNLGRTYIFANENDLAIKIFKELLEQEPLDEMTRYQIGVAYQRKGDVQAAKENYLAAIRADGSTAEAAAFNAAAIAAMGSENCASSAAREAMDLLGKSLNSAKKKGNLANRLSKVSGTIPTENSQYLERLRKCDDFKQLVATP